MKSNVNFATRLSDLAPGDQAQVAEMDASDPIARRLQDLGFVTDTRVRVVRRAPLGDPVEYEVRGTRLCLRRSEAARIPVRPEDAGAEAPS
ncbi:MAG: ferrous iron transport protein A [Proteobacteria bacterium]|nr:ferrous iron transport protein A [Pseudomonadota bacterium]